MPAMQENDDNDWQSLASTARDDRPPPKLTIIDPANWQDARIPERHWIVKDMIPARTVTLLAGDGAAGKTTLALQLGVARALDRDWLGMLPTAGRTLILSAEDDAEELHRRVEAIRLHYNAQFSDLSDLRLVDLVGESAVLGELTRNGIVKATPLFAAVAQEVESFRPDLLIADALADVFGGDENHRSQARQFIGLLKGLSQRFDLACLCLTHPSLTGMSSGSGTSGSTGWSNSVRSRLYFEGAKASDGSEPDPDLRTLSLRKANYAPVGATITVRWQRGVYVPETGPSSLDRMALAAKAEDVFFKLLVAFNEQGQRVSSAIGPTYAPKIFASHPNAKGIGKPRLAAAMQALLDRSAICLIISGPPSNRRSHLMAAG